MQTLRWTCFSGAVIIHFNEAVVDVHQKELTKGHPEQGKSVFGQNSSQLKIVNRE